ncbi:MAG: hypothetical protein AAGJ18_08970 [Bacteroidota bacterium]
METRKLTFDKNGYLVPYKMIEVDLATLKFNFVDAFPNSKRRQWLFDNYLRFLYKFQDNVFTYFEQWIDGSFISQKENPKDIDLVTFLDYSIYEKRGEKVLNDFWKFSLEDQYIDSYIVKEYPKDHPKYSVFLSEKNLWIDRYSTTRTDEPKGFLKLVFRKS